MPNYDSELGQKSGISGSGSFSLKAVKKPAMSASFSGT